jgi:hypothetical protein
MTFMQCLTECANNKELVKEFDRLADCNLSFDGTPIDLMIDQATGKLADDLQKFIEFVWDCVYTRIDW